MHISGDTCFWGANDNVCHVSTDCQLHSAEECNTSPGCIRNHEDSCVTLHGNQVLDGDVDCTVNDWFNSATNNYGTQDGHSVFSVYIKECTGCTTQDSTKTQHIERYCQYNCHSDNHVCTGRLLELETDKTYFNTSSINLDDTCCYKDESKPSLSLSSNNSVVILDTSNTCLDTNNFFDTNQNKYRYILDKYGENCSHYDNNPSDCTNDDRVYYTQYGDHNV